MARPQGGILMTLAIINSLGYIIEKNVLIGDGKMSINESHAACPPKSIYLMHSTIKNNKTI